MCSQADDPSGWDSPTPQPPRTYRLAGTSTAPSSIALAVIGTELDKAETDLRNAREARAGATTVAMAMAVVDALRRTRNHVADAEHRKPVVGGVSYVAGPSDAELREEMRADRELMRDEMHGRDIDGNVRW